MLHDSADDGVKNTQIYDIYLPLELLRLFNGLSSCAKDIWRILGCNVMDNYPVVGTIIDPMLSLQPMPFCEACLGLWLGGDCIENDGPHDN